MGKYKPDLRESLEDMIVKRPSKLKEVKNKILSNEMFFRRIIQKQGTESSVLYYADDVIKDNEIILLEAINLSAESFYNSSDRLKNKKDFVKKVIEKDGALLRLVGEELRGDKEIVLLAIKKSGYPLEYASKELKNDKALVLKAVTLSGQVLSEASNELQDDKDVVLAAVNSDAQAVYNVSERLRNDIDIAKAVANKNIRCFELLGEDIKKDKVFLYSIENIVKSKLYPEDDTKKIHSPFLRKQYEQILELIEAYKEEDLLSAIINKDVKPNKVLKI